MTDREFALPRRKMSLDQTFSLQGFYDSESGILEFLPTGGFVEQTSIGSTGWGLVLHLKETNGALYGIEAQNPKLAKLSFRLKHRSVDGVACFHAQQLPCPEPLLTLYDPNARVCLIQLSSESIRDRLIVGPSVELGFASDNSLVEIRACVLGDDALRQQHRASTCGQGPGRRDKNAISDENQPGAKN